jgi:hypothetical protein
MVKRSFRDIAQEGTVALALAEKGISEKALNLGPFLAQGTDLLGHGYRGFYHAGHTTARIVHTRSSGAGAYYQWQRNIPKMEAPHGV